MMTMDHRVRRSVMVVLGLLLGVALLARPAAAFFENIYTFEGVLGSVTEKQITVVNEANVVVPIMVPPDVKVPTEILVGQHVWVELERLEFNMWKLRKIRRAGTGPLPQPRNP